MVGGVQYPAEVRVFGWDVTTGVVAPVHLSTFPISQTMFPVAGVNTGYRSRFDPDAGTSNGAGSIYFTTNPYLLQFRYAGSGNDVLTLTGYWRSDYDDAIQDCRVYTLPGSGDVKGILSVKDREAFAFVKTVP